MEVVPPERKPLSVKVTPEAYAHINAFCAARAVTVSAFIESAAMNFLSHYLSEELELSGESGQILQTIIEGAREIDYERRRRPKEGL